MKYDSVLLRLHLVTTTALGWMALMAPQDGAANPEDGIVAAGSATITTQPKLVEVTQHSERAIIDWRSFDIAPDETTRFHQPSNNSFTLNRIRGGTPTNIYGTLTANGNIAVINPNGVMVHGGATIDVNSLVVSTADTHNDAFMAGGALKLSIPGNPDAQVINRGSITVKQAGLVGLVGPHVENDGVIAARLGKVHLASGSTAVLDMAGDGLINVAVNDAVASQLVRNSGTISADGGVIALTAADALHSVNQLVSNTGTLQANSVANIGGKIVLKGSGRTEQKGTVLAKGTQAGEKGGSIHILGDKVLVAAASQTDASGKAGGGEVLAGGDFQGRQDRAISTASSTVVEQDAVIDVSATEAGDGGRAIVWADGRARFAGAINAKGGVQGGDGGFVEVSGKDRLEFNGLVNTLATLGKAGTLLLDPTDIVISNLVDDNVTGADPFEPTVNNGPSNLSVTTLENQLALGNVTVQTIAGGGQPGNITVSNAIDWSLPHLLTLDAHNIINVNATIDGPQLRFIARDVNLNANISDNGAANGSVWFDLKDMTDTIGLAGGAGSYNLGTGDLNRIQDGYENITFGNLLGTGGINLNARTWTDNLTLLSSTGNINIAGTQTMGANNLTLTGRAMNIGGSLNGTGTLTIAPDIDESIGMGTAAAGTLHFDNAEMSRLDNTWSEIIIGNTGTTGVKTFNYTTTVADPLTIRSGTGLIDIASNLAIGANNLTLIGRDIAIGGNLTGTGTLTIAPDTDVSIGLGDLAVGDLHFSDLEVARMDNTFSSIVIGDLGTTAAKNVNYAGTLADPLTIQSGTGVIDIQGPLAMGGNNLTLVGRDINVGATLAGTGALRLRPDTDVDIGIGSGAAGVLTFSDTEILNMMGTWNPIIFGELGTTGIKTVGSALTWDDPMQIHSGTGLIDIQSDITMGNNSLALIGRNVNIAANITGAGTSANLTIRPDVDATVGIGTGAGGTLQLDDNELAFMGTTWNSRNFGLSGNTLGMVVNSYTWADPVTLNSGTGLINIAGPQVFGGNNFTINGRNVTIGATVTGTGTLTARPDTNATVGIGTGAGGTFNLDNTELTNIAGWGGYAFGLAGNTQTTNILSRSWNAHLTVNGGAGLTTVAAQTVGNHNITLNARNLNVTGALSGTGTLTAAPDASATVGIGDGTGGTFNISDIELGFFGNSWGSVILGLNNNSQATNIAGRTWDSALTIRGGAGLTTILGDLIMGNNNLTISARNLTIDGQLQGTGTLTLQPDTNATVGIGTGAGGTFNIDDDELALFANNGWSRINFGNTGSTGAMNVLQRAWNSIISFRTGAGTITIAGDQDMGNHDLILSGGGFNIDAALNGTGNLTIQQDASRTMGIGTLASGTVHLDNDELNRITDGWELITFGNASSTADMEIQDYTWRDDVTFRSATGTINVNGVQNMGGNDLTFTTRSLNIANSLIGSGTLTIQPDGSTRSMAIGNGVAADLVVGSAQLDHIIDGWEQLVFGREDSTAGMNLRQYTWRDNTIFRSNTGAISVTQAQNFGGNDAMFLARSLVVGANLSGTGNLYFTPNATNQTIGIGNGAGGALNLDTNELNFIQDGFNLITFGREDGTAAIDLRAHTWRDDVMFLSDTGVITVAGNQDFGTSNATFRSNSDVAINNLLSGAGNLAFENIADGLSWVLAGAGGAMNFTVAELDRIQNGFSNIRFGRAGATGAMDVNAYSWNDPFTFQTSGGITLHGAQTAVAGSDVSAALLGSSTMGTHSLDFSNTAVGAGGITLGAGTHSLTGDLISNGGDITINGALSMGGAAAAQRTIDAKTGALTVGATGSVAVTDKRLDLIADTMVISGALSGADRLRILTSTPTRAMTIGQGAAGVGLNFDDTEIAQIGAGFSEVIFGDYAQSRMIELRNATFTNRVQVLTADDITLAGVITANAAGDSLVLAAGDRFINTHGAGALVSAGRHLVYSNTPLNDTLNDIDRPTKRYGRTYTANPPSGVTETGNVFMYALTPTLTITAEDDVREYGLPDPSFTYSHSGLISDDTIDEAISGSPSLTTIAGLGSGIGHYVITAGAGGLTNLMGYTITYVNGDMEIVPAPLTVRADNKERRQSDPNPVYTATPLGLRNGDSPALLSGLIFSSTGDSATSIGTYSIVVSGGTAGANYVLAYVDGVLTVTTDTPSNPVPDNVIYVGNNPASQSSLLLSMLSNQESGFSMSRYGSSLGQLDADGDWSVLGDRDVDLSGTDDSEYESRTYRYKNLSLNVTCDADEENSDGCNAATN